MLIKEYRHPIEKVIWSLPMGGQDKGEQPSQTALRELTEETGIVAKDCFQIGTFYPAPGFTSQKAFVFLSQVSEADLESAKDTKLEENIKAIKVVTLNEVEELVQNGEINEGFTLSSLHILNAYLKKN